MAFRPRWSALPSSTLISTTSTNLANISPVITSVFPRQTYRTVVRNPRAKHRAKDLIINRKNGDGDDSSDDSQVSDTGLGVTADGFASDSSSSFANCDSGSLFCPVGTCYYGVNGYIGCCTVSSCAARTTCISYHSGQKSCDGDTEGCVFCSNPATPYCYHFENWGAIPTQFALWCTNSPSNTIVFYSNPIIYPSIADLPSVTFTPSWPTTSTSNNSASSSASSTSLVTHAAASSVSFNDTVNQTSPDSSVTLSTDGIVGIAVGGAVALALIVAAAAIFLWRNKRHKSKQEDLMEQPRGTLGGAVLPGTWFGRNGSGEQTDARRIPTASDSIRLIQQPEISNERSEGPELGDTTVPAYTIELGGTSTNASARAPFNAHQAMRIRPSFVPYSPMSIILPGSPYVHQRASYSDPVLGNRQGSQMSSENYQDLDGHGWMQQNRHRSRIQGSTHSSYTPFSFTNTRQGQLPVISRIPSQPSPATTLSGIISPLSISSTSFPPRTSSLQPDTIIPKTTSEKHDSSLSTSSGQGSRNPVPGASQPQSRNEFTLDQSTSLTSHPSNGGFVLPPRQSSKTAATRALSSSIDPIESPNPSSSHLVANTRLGPDQRNASAQEVSARGSWSTWVTPEAAYTEGLWEGQGSPKNRQGEASETEHGKKEKKD